MNTFEGNEPNVVVRLVLVFETLNSERRYSPFSDHRRPGLNSTPAPAAQPVPFSVDAQATVPGSVADCMPSEITTSKDVNNQPLDVMVGATTNVARIDFTGCT